MMPRGRGAPLIPAALALLSLIAGLGVGPLRTGQVDPLHWLWPALAALAVMAGYLLRRNAEPCTRDLIGGVALLAVPPVIFSTVAGSRLPVVHGAILISALALVALVAARVRGRWLMLLPGAIALAALVPTLIGWMERPVRLPDPPTAVLSGVPLAGVDVGQAQGPQSTPMPDSFLDRAPFWQGLAARRSLRAIDALDASTLAGIRDLLLVQPRLLQPRELVALDAWVRGGARAVILADPFLLWPDARPLGHVRRPPVTSLLDPLLTHWGLQLEPASIVPGQSMVERRVLGDGTLLNLAGSSTFATIPGGTARCTLSERGLIAACHMDRGQALLVADADFIEASLWTIAPENPERHADWTSGAISFVDDRLGGSARSIPGISWVIDDRRLVLGLFCAVLAVVLMAALLFATKMLSHAFPDDTSEKAKGDLDHKRNI